MRIKTTIPSNPPAKTIPKPIDTERIAGLTRSTVTVIEGEGRGEIAEVAVFTSILVGMLVSVGMPILSASAVMVAVVVCEGVKVLVLVTNENGEVSVGDGVIVIVEVALVVAVWVWGVLFVALTVPVVVLVAVMFASVVVEVAVGLGAFEIGPKNSEFELRSTASSL